MGPAECPCCRSLVGVHRAAAAGFGILILPVTLASSLIVLIQAGFYAALLWFPFPIGALGYLKARFCPLEPRHDPRFGRRAAASPDLDTD